MPRRVGRALRIGALAVVGGVSLLVAAGWALTEFGHPIYGPNACNAGNGNPFIDDAVLDRLPDGTLRAPMSTGPDCDDTRTGSVAAGWAAEVRPADIVDRLVGQGFARSDPAGGSPSWYVGRGAASDPTVGCLVSHPATWQSYGRSEYPTPACSGPIETQIVLEKRSGPHYFVVRINHAGMTADAAHKRDGDSAKAIRLAQPDSGEED